MRGNRNQTWKYYGKPAREKMRTREVLRKNSRLRKTFKDFWRNGSCTQYRYRKIKAGRSMKDVHVPRLCAKLYWRYIPHVNLGTNFIALSRDVIWINKTYVEYVSRKENTKEDTYTLQDEDKSYNWAHIQINPVNNEVKNESVKTEETVNTN